jgi:dihydropteroate synthase
MGVLNVTPDSFSDGGLFLEPQHAVEQGLRLAEAGADVIDVGGESSRPGAAAVSLEEELARTIPVIRLLAAQIKIPLSIDTAKAQVAEQALAVGASIINDVTGLESDPRMPAVAAQSQAAVVVMHMQGNPRTMQLDPQYEDVVAEVKAYLVQRALALQRQGIDRSRIIIDPGIGFGKSVEHNLQLMRGLTDFVATGYAVLLGPSRKSFLGKLFHATVDQRLAGTLACVGTAAEQGVHIVRAHDVAQVKQFLSMRALLHHTAGSDAGSLELRR